MTVRTHQKGRQAGRRAPSSAPLRPATVLCAPRRSLAGTERGFSLLEVVVALAILAVSLGVLMESQVSSLASAGRARNLTIATLLARGKMIDVEQQLFDEGFTVGDQEEDGDFSEEGHAEIKWKAKVMEVEIDLAQLGGMGGGTDEEDAGSAGMSADSVLSGMGGAVDGLVKSIGDNMRVVDLTVTWPDGKYQESMHVRAVVTRDDLGNSSNAGGLPGTAGSGFGSGGGSGSGAQQRGGLNFQPVQGTVK